MIVRIKYIAKTKGETLDRALEKCGGFKFCHHTPEEALKSAEQNGFKRKDIQIVKVQYETLKQYNFKSD